jgi:DNA-binding response OmpR family regulator
MKILVAEDNELFRKFIQKTLADWEFETLAVSNGIEAWEAIEKNSDIQIVIADWLMPGISGLELCQKIRESIANRYIYIILLTMKEHHHDAVAGFEAGADDYITKPFQRDEFKARLKAGVRVVDFTLTQAKSNANNPRRPS